MFQPKSRFSSLFAAALGGGIVAAGLVTVLLWGLGLLAPPPLAPQASPIAPAAAPLTVGSPPVYLTNYAADLPNAAVDLRAAAERATPSVVHITALAGQQDRERIKALFGRPGEGPAGGGSGSGVIYRNDGYILTNYHVVRGAAEITVTTNNRQRYPAALVGYDPKSDLAVLRISGENFPTLKLTNSDEARPGEWVLAVGSPLGLTSTVTAGIISAKGRSIRMLRDLDAIESFIQTDAAINPGNSGGPLVNAEGKLLGINTAIATETGRFQGYGFAIPINLVRRIADDIIEFGSYRRGYLGVEISTLTSVDVRRLGLKDRSEGVLIDAVFEDGSAAAAGLQPDDVVVGVNGRAIRDLPELTEIIGRARVGETLKIRVVRSGTAREVIVTLLAFPE